MVEKIPGQGVERSLEDEIEAATATEAPRYRLTERAYIHDMMHEPGAEVTVTWKPGKHMTPLNAAAKQMYEKHRREIERDPLQGLMVSASYPGNGEVPMLTPAETAAIKALVAELLGDRLGNR